jgi:hypothetical protein
LTTSMLHTTCWQTGCQPCQLLRDVGEQCSVPPPTAAARVGSMSLQHASQRAGSVCEHKPSTISIHKGTSTQACHTGRCNSAPVLSVYCHLIITCCARLHHKLCIHCGTAGHQCMTRSCSPGKVQLGPDCCSPAPEALHCAESWREELQVQHCRSAAAAV